MRWLFLFGALVFGLAAGFWLGSNQVDHGAEKPASANHAPGSANGTAAGKEASEAEALTESEKAAASRTNISKAWLESLESEGQLEQLEALIPKIRNASPEDFAALMDAIGKFGGNLEYMSRNLIATRWAERAPEAMLNYIRAQPANQQSSLNRTFYSVWAREDPEAAFKSAKGIEDLRIRSSAMQSVVNAVASKEPQRAIEMAQAMEAEAGRNYSWMLRNIFRTWANSEPDAARRAALSLPEGESKVRALSGALGEWMSEDPVAALNWLDSLPPDGSVYNSRREVFQNFLNQDFETAKQFIEQRVDPLERREILSSMYFGNFAWRMDSEEMEGIFDWLGKVSSGETYDRKVSDLVQSMAQIDPDRTIEFTLNLPPGNARMNALGQLGSKLAEQDPARAIAFAEGLEFEDEKDRVLQYMGWRLSRYGAESVSKLIAASDDDKVQQQLAHRITAEWSKYDREAALDWVENLEDENVRNNARRPIFNNWLQSDPEAALSYLQSSIAERRQSSYLSNAFGQWTREDPEAAIEWLERLPEPLQENRSNIYGQVTNYYVRHNPMAASEWIATLDQGPERDRSVESLVNHISKNDPEAAFIWATTVDNDSRRQSTLNRSVQEWVKNDPAAALAGVTEARIEAKEKEPLLELIGKAQ